MVQGKTRTHQKLTLSFGDLLVEHFVKCVWGAVVIRVIGHVLFALTHLHEAIPSFSGRITLSVILTALTACVGLAWRRWPRFNRSAFVALHLTLVVQYPLESILFGNGPRELWLFMLMVHAVSSIALIYDERKALLMGAIILAIFPIGYFMDSEGSGAFNQKFLLLFIGLMCFSVVEFFGARFAGELREKDRRILELAEQNETGLRILSHDMANLLAVARDTLELSMEEIDDNGGQMTRDAYTYLDDSRFAIGQGIGMLQAVRDYLAIFSGKKDPAMEHFYLSEVLKDVVQLWQRPARRKQVSIALVTRLMREETCIAGSRPIFTHTIIGNLISNAIKFSPVKGRITLILEREPGTDMLLLEVRDQGAGIAQSKLDAIFDARARTTSVGTKGEHGTGFGLPLVKTTLTLFGGEIFVSTQIEGNQASAGSRFICRIPMSRQGTEVGGKPQSQSQAQDPLSRENELTSHTRNAS